MTTLYDIKGALANLIDLLENEDLTQEQMENLSEVYTQMQGDFDQKIENTVKVIRNYESDVNAIDEEIKRLQAKKKSAQARADWLRNNIKMAMIALDKNKVKTALCTVSLSDEKIAGVQITGNVDDLPKEFQKIKIEADKTALKNALMDGIEIDGVELYTNRTLTIR